MITSARGRNCAIESATSPVPGGMSTTRKSGSAQWTSVRNCSSALCSIGPRQMTAWSSPAKKPIEMSRTPLASGGTITSSMSAGGCWMPSIRGIEKPQTSASTAATRCPRWASAIERLVVIDDLPTPPLPDEIASTRVRASTNGFVRGRAASRSAVAASTTRSGSGGGSPFRMRATAGSSSSRIGRTSTSTRSTPSTAPAAARIRATSWSRMASSGIGQGEGDDHGGAVGGDPLDHPQLDDRPAQLGVVDGPQGLTDGGLDGLGGGWAGATAPPGWGRAGAARPVRTDAFPLRT